MQKRHADILLSINPFFECTNRICLNQGTCLNIAGFSEQHHPRKQGRNDEVCVCDDQFFGPNCEFDEDDLYDLGRSRRSLDVGLDVPAVPELVNYDDNAGNKTDMIEHQDIESLVRFISEGVVFGFAILVLVLLLLVWKKLK